ncbi:MAG TPA: hypothetical protein VGC00_10185, partial [Thermoanaerobaculia bacterium]
EWRELAADARADAETNRDRAARQPDYADNWNDWAGRDDARADERDANAERLEQEAKRIEDGMRDQSAAAEERRGRAEAARQEAAAAKQALDLARAEYEACLERQRMKCEQERREAVLAALRSQAAATTTTTSSGGGSTAPRSGTTPGGGSTAPAGGYNPYRTVPVRLAPFCEWVHYELPEGSLVDNVQVVGLTSRDTPSALEVRTMKSRSGSRAGSFDYHCKASAGTAVIRWRVDGTQNYQMRIGCVPE